MFNAVVDRTRSRLEVPKLRTLFGIKKRPHHRSRGKELSPREAVVIETPRWDLTLFKVHGLLTLKGYTKGEHELRFEAIVHNTQALGCGRVLEKFPDIVTRLAAMTDRFASMLDCVDIGFLPDGVLDDLPAPSQIGATQVGGVDLNKARMRNALAAVSALAVAPHGFTSKVHAMTGQTEADYSLRQAAYDLRKIRGKHLVVMPDRSRRYWVPPSGCPHHHRSDYPARAGHRSDRRRVRSPRQGRKPTTWTRIDQDYEALRIDMQTLFGDLAITTETTLAA